MKYLCISRDKLGLMVIVGCLLVFGYDIILLITGAEDVRNLYTPNNLPACAAYFEYRTIVTAEIFGHLLFFLAGLLEAARMFSRALKARRTKPKEV